MTNLIRMAREIISISQVFHHHINSILHSATDFKLDTFTQIWGSTSGGFEGIGGQMMTEERTYVFTPLVEGEDYMVFFGGGYAYSVSPDNKNFQEDLKHGNIAGQHTAIGRYGKSYRKNKNSFVNGVNITNLLQMVQEILNIEEDFPNYLNDFKKYNEADFHLYIFTQTWNDISGGFEQGKEKALTDQRTYVFSPMIDGEDYIIFFGGRYAYSVALGNKNFEEDLKNGIVSGRRSAKEKYGNSCRYL